MAPNVTLVMRLVKVALMLCLVSAALVALGVTRNADPSVVFGTQGALVEPNALFWYLGGIALLWLLFGLARLTMQGTGDGSCWTLKLLIPGLVCLAVSLLVIGAPNGPWAVAAFSTASWLFLIEAQLNLGPLRYEPRCSSKEPFVWFSWWSWPWNRPKHPPRDLGHWAAFVVPLTLLVAVVGGLSWLAWLAAWPSSHNSAGWVIGFYYGLQVGLGALMELTSGTPEYPISEALVAATMAMSEIHNNQLRIAVYVATAVHTAAALILLARESRSPLSTSKTPKTATSTAVSAKMEGSTSAAIIGHNMSGLRYITRPLPTRVVFDQ